uniref:DNA-directed RNA polymerase n=1 Tax=Schizomeris leibleinii TaxID=104533 RepID=F8SYE2_9CHLO|nr:alpha subunit of RNA polymerase [Schizomeris leibleinii]AEH05393.1 alpha subunit of RNA polymerase [Schizomeris leibleinii]
MNVKFNFVNETKKQPQSNNGSENKTDLRKSINTFPQSVFKNSILVSCKESVMENRRSFYGKYYIGPLEVGQGLTLANALRRSLLSELTGLAITSVEIEGVSHEYSTIKGVHDSVLDILLNLKQIILKSKVLVKRPQTGYIHFQGPGVLRAQDIYLPSSIQCVDPEQYIATLSDNGLLKMKLVIRQGKNYVVQTPSAVKTEPLQNTDKKKEFINFLESKIDLNKFLLNSMLAKKENKELDNLIKKRQKGKKPFDKSVTTNSFSIKLKSTKNTKLERSVNQIFEKIKTKKLFAILFKKYLFSVLFSEFLSNVNNFSMNDSTTDLISKNTSNTKSLVIDAVFMPVTKVNYILEENHQKLFNEQNLVDLQSFKNTQMDIQEIIESIENPEQNMEIKSLSLEKKTNKNSFWSLFTEDLNSSLTNIRPSLEEEKYFENYNKSPKEMIILEIWTNGSILPSTALKQAAKKLLTLFIKFKRAKLMNSTFFKTKSNYEQTINTLNQRKKTSKDNN